MVPCTKRHATLFCQTESCVLKLLFEMANNVCSLELVSEVAHLPDLSLSAFGLQMRTTVEFRPDYFFNAVFNKTVYRCMPLSFL